MFRRLRCKKYYIFWSSHETGKGPPLLALIQSLQVVYMTLYIVLSMNRRNCEKILLIKTVRFIFTDADRTNPSTWGSRISPILITGEEGGLRRVRDQGRDFRLCVDAWDITLAKYNIPRAVSFHQNGVLQKGPDKHSNFLCASSPIFVYL